MTSFFFSCLKGKGQGPFQEHHTVTPLCDGDIRAQGHHISHGNCFWHISLWFQSSQFYSQLYTDHIGSHFLLLCHFGKTDSLLLGQIVDRGDCSTLQGLQLFDGDGQADGGKVHESFTNNCVLLRPFETSGPLTWVTAFGIVSVHTIYTTYQDCKVVYHIPSYWGSAGRREFGSCIPVFSHVAFLFFLCSTKKGSFLSSI